MKINEVSNNNDSSYGINVDEYKDKSSPQSKRKLYIIFGIVVGVVIITTVVLLIVFLTGNNKPKITKSNGSNKQSIKLKIKGDLDSRERRNLQENQKVQIVGESFDELNPINAYIYIDNKEIPFTKYLYINTTEETTLEIVLRDNIKTFKNMFRGCQRLNEIALNNINTTEIDDTSSMFEGCEGLNEVKFEKMNISNIKDTNKMFKKCFNLKNIDIKNFSTGKVKNMSHMFEGCSSLNNTNFISKLSTKSSEDMSEMFFGCSELTSLDLSGFETSNSRTMKGMFKNMTSLINLNLKKFDTKKVELMNEMFENCISIETLALSSFSTENIVNMSRMFYSCTSLNSLDLSSFNVSNCLYHDNMFDNLAPELLQKLKKSYPWVASVDNNNKQDNSKENPSKDTTLPTQLKSNDTLIYTTLPTQPSNEVKITTIIQEQTEAKEEKTTQNEIKISTKVESVETEEPNTGDTTDSDSSFINDGLNETNPSDSYENEQDNASLLEDGQTISLLIEGEKHSAGRRNLEDSEEKIKIFGDSFNELGPENACIFLDNKKLDFNKEISIKSSTTVRLVVKFTSTIMTFKEMFSGCNRIKEVSLKNVETEFVLETTAMFEGCTNLNEVKFENTGIYNITSTAKMFQKCTSLNKIEIETFSTDKTKDMSNMFEGCSSLENGSFIEGLSTKSAESMEGMLSGCSEIKSLDLSGFDTSNVKDMSGMFKGMTSLEELEISSFHTEKVEYMSEMFESCSSIINLNLSNFNTEMVINMDRMFSSCLKLEEVDLTSFKLKNCNSTLSMFSNTTRQLMLSIEKNEEVRIKAGMYWSEKETNITKVPLDILFLVDATGSMGGSIQKVKEDIVYISVNLINKTGMEYYDLSLGAIFYRDPVDSSSDIHEIFDFNKNALDFKTFVEKIYAIGGGDGPEDWAGAFNLAKKLSWGNDSIKFIIHIADAPAHGSDWVKGYPGSDYHTSEGSKTDEIITDFARKNFSIAGFKVYYYQMHSFKRAQTIYKNNGNYKYVIQNFDEEETDKNYFLNLVYDSFIYTQNVAILHGIDISEEQGDINWDIMKDNNSIDFVIIKAGEGIEKDKMFETNYNGAKNANIPIGIYWNSKANNLEKAKEEAQKCLEILDGKTFEFPIYYVIEDDNIFNNGIHNQIINRFCDVLDNSGINYLCSLRSSASKLQNSFKVNDIDDYPIWCYDGDNSIVSQFDAHIWKYSADGKINGIEGKVSLDQSIINYSKITLENHFNGY